jgi:hypothetical protein
MAIYNFLTEEDIEVSIKDDLLSQIVEGNSAFVPKSEARAVSYMKDFLRERFVVADIFPEIKAWVNTKAYKVSVEQSLTYTNHLGEEVTENFTPVYYRLAGVIVNVVYKGGKIYVALQDGTNKDPSNNANAAYWKEFDPRDQKIVGMCTDITLFYLHTRINPRKISELRTDMYNQAKEWLTCVRDGDLTPDLPKEVDIKKDIDTPLWGSSPQKGHYY